MRRILTTLIFLAIIAAAIGWVLTAPNTLSESELAAIPAGDAKAGEQIFYAAGCASCHAAPKATGEAKLVLAGGHAFDTPFGTFFAPNISPNKTQGIGEWSDAEFYNAMLRGVTPDGSHYYPAFPFTSYTRMKEKDLGDLWAFMKTLPNSDTASKAHDVGFPFNIRRGLGLWKLLYLNDAPITPPSNDPVIERGRYLVEALTHCGECHTPRNPIGGMDTSRWLAGGTSPDGKERIPNITPHKDGIGGWSVGDIVNSLETGFTPEFDSFGSSMADVVENTAKLPKSDLESIATYLKSVGAFASEKK